jgi:hypothetical protein
MMLKVVVTTLPAQRLDALAYNDWDHLSSAVTASAHHHPNSALEEQFSQQDGRQVGAERRLAGV